MTAEYINKTVETLLSGGVILYPTDTVWGIGCDASNADAVEKIYSIKHRDHSKSMLLLASDSFATGDHAIDLLLHSKNRPTTVIMPLRLLPGGMCVAPNLPADDGTLGIRIPRHAFCQEVIRLLGNPIVSTSANFSGQPTPILRSDIDSRLVAMVDYCLPDFPEFASGTSKPSRIVKLSEGGEIITLRV